MLSKIIRVVVICFPVFFVFSHTPKAYSKKNKYLVNVPVTTLYEECSTGSKYVTQAVYGHQIYLIESKKDGWALLETDDGSRGYGVQKELIIDNPRWRTSQRLCKTKSIGAMVYLVADTEWPALMRLPYDARIELDIDYNQNTDRWLSAQLINGKKVWIQRGDVEKITPKTFDEIIALAHQFQGLPYIWGGTSSEGYDCSGYIQTLFKQMGVLLPRDSRPQSDSDKLLKLDAPTLPGDILFWGRTNIGHVGLYLGKERFIHSGVWSHYPKIGIGNLHAAPCKLLAVRRIRPPVYESSIFQIDKNILKKMVFSWRENNPVPLSDLRYVRLTHWGFDGCVHEGEFIVHEKVAKEVIEIFQELFEKKYPIEKMLLIDIYKADDDLSCEDNNTCCFCSRPFTGKNDEWSMHSYGLAIDINPLLNPYYNKAFRTEGIIGEEFLERTLDCRGMIKKDDDCYKAFTSRGWKWAGHWYEERGYVDYQHFYKEL